MRIDSPIDDGYSFDSEPQTDKAPGPGALTTLSVPDHLDSDSDYRSLTPSPSVGDNRSDLDNSRSEPFSEEPEAETIESFRRYGVRFITNIETYSQCSCGVPQQLLQWQYNVSEVAVVARDELPVSLQFRWSEIRQDFGQDLFGDLQFQDFLLAREQRGPFHAMIHFSGVFANVGYYGRNWYWVTVGDDQVPFFEEEFEEKSAFIQSLKTLVRQQSSLGQGCCPEPSPNAHLYVRTELDGLCRMPYQEEEANCELEESWPNDDMDSIEGLPRPKRLSYADMYCDSYFNLLGDL